MHRHILLKQHRGEIAFFLSVSLHFLQAQGFYNILRYDLLSQVIDIAGAIRFGYATRGPRAAVIFARQVHMRFKKK